MNKIVKYLYNNYNPLIIFGFYLLLILSFFLNLDPNSGAYLDYQIHKKISQNFSQNFVSTLINYDQESTRHSPVLLIIFSFFEKLNFQDIYIRMIGLHFCLLLPFIFYKIIRLKFDKFDKNKSIFLISLIFISPTFISLSIWPDSRIYGLIFFTLSIYFYLKFEIKNRFSDAIKCTLSYTLSAYISLNFSLFAIFFLLKFLIFYKFNKKILYLIVLNLLLALPALFYIFYLDNIFFLKSGIAGKEFDLNESLNYSNKILIIPTVVFFYLLPFYFSKMIFFKNFNVKHFIISIIVVFLCSLSFSYTEDFSGGGIFFKFLGLLFDNNYAFYLISLISIYIILKLCENKPFNTLIIFLLIISNLQYSIYHKYYDPLLLILFFSIFDIKLKNNINKINFIYFYSFGLAFLSLNFLKQII